MLKKATHIFLAIAAIGAGIFFARYNSSVDSVELSGFAFPSPKQLTDVALIDQDAIEFTTDKFRDHWTFIYLGYTFCPDACPMTLVIMDQLYELLAEADDLEDNISMMLISVDPERDTPDRLKSYVSHFNESFIGATGTDENLKNFASQVSAVYSVPDDRTDPNYLVDHSSTIILINPDAEVHAVFTPPQEADKLATDFKLLRARFN